MTIKKLKDFIFENYHQWIEFAKENSYYSMKHQKKQICNCLLLKLKGTSTAAVDPQHLKVEVAGKDFLNCSCVINRTWKYPMSIM